MGCFFACFRMRDQKPNLVANRFPSQGADSAAARRQLASVLMWGDNGTSDEKEAGRSSGEGGVKDGVDSAIKREAKFLKSIGTLPETPAEIRRASQKTFAQTGNDDNLSANSCLRDTVNRKLDWNEQHGQISHSLSQVHESAVRGHKLERCNSMEHQKSRKGMEFEEQTEKLAVDLVSDSVKDISPPRSDHSHPIVCSTSPYPTPMHLTGEMQSPGTVYAGNVETPAIWKNARTRTQYVYPVFTTEESQETVSEMKLPMENSCQVSNQHIYCTPDSKEKIFSSSLVAKKSRLSNSPKSSCSTYKTDQNKEIDFKENYVQDVISGNAMPALSKRHEVCLDPVTPESVVPGLSEWLKPPLPKRHEVCSPSGKSPDVERPIIGLVATHWNADEPSHVTQHMWDGNGIPNSTNKYKEDQKVSWHATPFEERLEKALSDETLLPQRKLLNGKPIQFEVEGEETDTAAS